MIELDARLSGKMCIAEQPGPRRTLAVIMAHSGDSWFWLPGLGLLWWKGTEYWKELAVVMIAGILITALMVFFTKQAVRRRRPEGEWGKFYRSTDPHSFPSGHAARAAMLVLVALMIGPVWLGVLLTVWAALVGLSRVAMSVHYLSDVVAGWMLGLLMAVVVLLIF